MADLTSTLDLSAIFAAAVEAIEVTHAVTTTCGYPTASGTPCSREGASPCGQHKGRSREEWAAHHAEVARKREEYLASPDRAERKAKVQARVTRKAANRLAAEWCRQHGHSTSGPEWRAKRDSLLAGGLV